MSVPEREMPSPSESATERLEDPAARLDRLLDNALEDSFPASDPLSTMRPAN